jgi:vacuolar-type H+-ATPase subunit E/Vma4
LHPKPPSPSLAFTSPAFAEKVVEGVKEFIVNVLVVVRNPHVDGAVENHEDEIDEEDRQRYVAKHQPCTFGSSSRTRSRRPSSGLPLESADASVRVDNVFCM